MSLDGGPPGRPEARRGSDAVSIEDRKSGRRRMKLSRTVRALITAALLLLVVVLAPSTPWRGVGGGARPGDGAFSAAFSVEPTVSVSIGSPVHGGTVGRFVALEATAVADRGLERLAVMADGVTLVDVKPASRPTGWRLSTIWDSGASGEGTASVTVVAEDAAGARREQRVDVSVDHTAPKITFSEEPESWALSPNGDGSRDRLSVMITASEPVDLSVVVRDGAYARELVSTTVPRRVARVSWDGRLSSRPDAGPAADGLYPMVVQASDLAGNSHEATHAVAIDRVPPSAASAKVLGGSVRPAKRERARFSIQATDDGGLVVVGVKVANEAGRVVRRTRPAPVTGGSVTAVWDGRYENGRVVPPGVYETTVSVSDPAGNEVELAGGTIRVHAVRKPTTIFAVRTTEPVVALTFDDLYDAKRTNQILDILARYEAKATFFAVGRAAKVNPALMRRIVAEGHALGNHSESHPVMTRLGAAAQRVELQRAEKSIRRAAGRTTAPLFRPPYGATNASVARAAARTEHPYVFLWDVDTLDWASPGVARIISGVKRGAGPGSIVLMHGGPPQTPKALPTILRDLKEKGLEPVTLPELLWIGGYR